MNEKQLPNETPAPLRKGIDPTPYAADLNQPQSPESSQAAPQEPPSEPTQSDTPADPGSGDQAEGS